MTADTRATSPEAHSCARQRIEFRNGNEAAALAARDSGFEVMGYYPVTPSAELAESLESMRSKGAHGIALIDGADGPGAAGLCYGAALGGARVLGATNSQGLLAALRQLSAQSGARVPMVLNVATRAVLGAPHTGCDHSDIYHALNSGWVILCARDPQAVYDLNLAAVRIGEHPEVRLPVLVAYDGFITSHEKRHIAVLDDPEALARFVGVRPRFATPLDAAQPATFGAHMDGTVLINNQVQLSNAMDAARRVIPGVFADLAKLTGRAYPVIDAYAMEDAEVAVVLLNSAADTAKEAVDVWRDIGRKVGVLSPNVLRPFPAREFRAYLRGVKAATIGDRADSYGAGGGNLSLEVRAAIQADRGNDTRVLSRIYGLGGSDFTASDAEQFLDQALDAATSGQVREPFAYHGATPGSPDESLRRRLAPIPSGEVSRGMAKVCRDEASGRLEVELEPLWKMTSTPNRLAPGHGACPGCGVFPTLHQIYKALEGEIVVLFQSGCASVVSAAYPSTAHRVNVVHTPPGNGAAALSGLIEAYRARAQRGELPASKDVTFVMIAGDGGMDESLGNAIGAANRRLRMMVIEYDNQGRMSTGALPSYSTPLGAQGKAFHHGDTAQVFAACHLPYVFTASEGYPEDLMRKVAKAQWYAKNEGMVYGKILSFCPLNWRTADDAAQPVLQAAIDSCFFPLYEVEHGHTAITYDPDEANRRRPVADWLKLMGKTAHLADPAHAAIVERIQAETDRRWTRLKAMHDHPLL